MIRTYYYDFRNDDILKKDDEGNCERINFIGTWDRDKGEGFYRRTHAMITCKSGRILMYCHYSLRNKLKEAYHQNIRNKVREEVIHELSVGEPLITI